MTLPNLPYPNDNKWGRCSECKYFEHLKHNPNFGKCKLGITNKDELEQALSAMFGGTVMQIPVVHKEDIHTCFESK